MVFEVGESLPRHSFRCCLKKTSLVLDIQIDRCIKCLETFVTSDPRQKRQPRLNVNSVNFNFELEGVVAEAANNSIILSPNLESNQVQQLVLLKVFGTVSIAGAFAWAFVFESRWTTFINSREWNP